MYYGEPSATEPICEQIAVELDMDAEDVMHVVYTGRYGDELSLPERDRLKKLGLDSY